MHKNLLLLAACVLLMLPAFAQNIGINEDGSRPNANAILDLKSGNKGVLIPRMDSVARKTIPNTKGLLVYDISTDNFWYNTGEKWECIPNEKDRKKGGEAWLLKGNANTKDSVDFLGTTDNVPLNIRVNNQSSGRIDSAKGSTFWGYLAGGSNSTGVSNTAIGFKSLPANTSGNGNTAIGTQALFSSTKTNYNTATGYQSMYSNNTGTLDNAAGYQSMYSNTSGSYNNANGYQAMFSNVSGGDNTASGYQALFSNDVASGNTADGTLALYSNTSGEGNTAVGVSALYENVSGSSNIAVGNNTMFTNLSGNNNTAIGDGSLSNNVSFTTGSGNTAVGYSSLRVNVGGNYNTAIGNQADVSTPYLTNTTAIGNGAIVDASNKVRIGNSAVTVIEGQVPFTTPSDGRYKFNVRDDVKGLDFILQLRPVTYQFDVKRFDANLNHATRIDVTPANYALQAGYDEATRIRRSGFIAQEVEQAANTSGYDFSGIIKPKTEQDHYSLSYDAFVVPLVKAVQEQEQIILQQNKKLEEQDKKLSSLQTQLDEIKKLLQPAN
jgi:hypothetical protein